MLVPYYKHRPAFVTTQRAVVAKVTYTRVRLRHTSRTFMNSVTHGEVDGTTTGAAGYFYRLRERTASWFGGDFRH